jgi:hypothetical protein
VFLPSGRIVVDHGYRPDHIETRISIRNCLPINFAELGIRVLSLSHRQHASREIHARVPVSVATKEVHPAAGATPVVKH